MATSAGRAQTGRQPAAATAGQGAATSSVDVVVIGAGVSGLIAARELERQGRTTTVL